MSDTVKLILDGKEIELPVITGSENEKAIDISTLRATTGYITIDPGFKNTGSTQSSITYLDGENGILRYRGYSIEELAENATFLEVAYLLVYGELPNKDELAYFNESITQHTLVHENMKRFFDAFPQGAHPMGMLSSMIASLSTFYPESQNSNRSVIIFILGVGGYIYVPLAIYSFKISFCIVPVNFDLFIPCFSAATIRKLNSIAAVELIVIDIDTLSRGIL